MDFKYKEINRLAVFTLTDNGLKIASKIRDAFKEEEIGVDIFDKQNLKNKVGECFNSYSHIIFISAVGIAVRMIAPHLKSKLTDPGVIVIDDRGKFAVSLLSGHIGRANELTKKISDMIGATPVITTATDVNELTAFDVLASRLNAYVENFREATLMVNGALVNNETVYLYRDSELKEIEINGMEELEFLCRTRESGDILVIISVFDYELSPYLKDLNKSFRNIIKMTPRTVTLGVGCRRDKSPQELIDGFEDLISEIGLDRNSIVRIGSIDVKRDEKAINELAEHLGLECEFFSADELIKYEDRFEYSDFVKKTVGVGSVSQAAACHMADGGMVFCNVKRSGYTLALARIEI